MAFRSLCAVVSAIVFAAAPAFSAQISSPGSTATHAARPLLPSSFGGWSEAGAPTLNTDAGRVNVTDAEVLKEFGFQRAEQARYTHAGGKLAVQVMKFGDATGAYGAFTSLRPETMKPIEVDLKPYRVGNTSQVVMLKVSPTSLNGAEQGGHVLFWTGDLLVDATFDPVGPDDTAVLSALDQQLPKPPGPEGIAPSLPGYLPPEGLQPGTVRYAIGPLAYAKSGGVLPRGLIHFEQDAEAITARYGAGTLTLLLYPTPQIANGRVGAIDGALKSGAVAGVKEALLEKRVGPLVAVTSGNLSEADAKALLAKVDIHDYVTLDHPQGYVSEAAKTAKLLVGIATLTIILGGAAVLLGVFLGGGRAAYRVMRGKPASSLSDEEFIQLKIEE